MIKVFADDQPVYAPHLPDYELMTLQVTKSAAKSGTVTFTMPPNHPKYDSFVEYKTIVTIYRDNVLLFRGRAIPPTQDDFYNCRTITCEGELGFLLDSIVRPYLYQDTPEAIFADLIANHNAQVDAEKTFVAGEVTVKDPNDYIRLESTTAEETGLAIDKLLDRVGGYLVFTTNDEGQRVINWYEDPGYRSDQVIEFGSNLLDFSRSGVNAELATVIVPYGAADPETGVRVTIESVNDGLDFVQDDEAVALRGRITRAVYWEDVTEPANLLRKVMEYLANVKNIVTSLLLSAVDLSVMDKSIDSFRVFDRVRVRSKPHKVDEYFFVMERVYNLLNPDQDTITLGKEVATLTGADAAGDRKAQTDLHKTEASIRADYSMDIAKEIQAAKTLLATLIQQTETAIKLEVSETYVTNDSVDSKISTTFEQTKASFDFTFSELEKKVNDNDKYAREQFEERKKYIRFVDGNILLGEAGNELELKIQKDRISFYDSGAEVAYFSNKKLVVKDGNFLNSLQIGKFSFLPRDNGNLSLVKVGE